MLIRECFSSDSVLYLYKNSEILVLSTKMRTGRSGLGRSALVVRTVRACAEQIRVSSFVLRLLAKFAQLAREISL
jgi:hypothetical protein